MEGIAAEGEWELEAAGRHQIEEWVAAEKLATGNDLSRNDRHRGGGVDDEVFCADLGGSGRKGETAGVEDFSACGPRIDVTRGDGEDNFAAAECAGTYGSRGDSQ